MVRKWALAALAALTLLVGLAAYHLYVVDRSGKHYRLLLESQDPKEKRIHYDEIFRFFHPWNPYRERARRWFREEAHEWQYLGLGSSGGSVQDAKP